MKPRLIFPVALAAIFAAASPVQAQLFGESDEVKAARQAHEDGQDAATAQLQQQLRDLTERVRSLTDSLARATGANEELGHQLAVTNEKLETARKDFAYRLCMLSAQQLGADPQGLNCAAAGTESASRAPQSFTPGAPLPPLGASPQSNFSQNSPNQNNFSAAPQNSYGGNSYGGSLGDNAPAVRGRPPGTLGTLPSGPPARLSPAPAASAPPDGRAFDAAMNLLAKAQYTEASAAFRTYADAHPDDTDLSPQALYWVGDIAYVQQDYGTAARTFAEQIKKYPSSSRSADAMLKIGQSLIAQGQNSGGCTALGAIKKQYPDASASTLTAALNARKAANCK